MTMLYLLVLVLILGAAGWLAWYFLGPGAGALFGTTREARIGVSEIVAIEGKRKLLLIHRDGVEHLVMTGGPVDVVIEQGILPQRRPAAVPAMGSHASLEPRLATQPPPSAAGPDAGQELQPGFGRLRQRGAPASIQEPPQRVEGGLTAGLGKR